MRAGALLQQAFEVIDAWGFTYKTTAFCCVKPNKSGIGYVTGLGGWTRSNAEVWGNEVWSRIVLISACPVEAVDARRLRWAG